MVYIIMKLINKTLINILIHKRQILFPYYSRKSFRGIRLSFFSQCHTKHNERGLKIKFIEKKCINDYIDKKQTFIQNLAKV